MPVISAPFGLLLPLAADAVKAMLPPLGLALVVAIFAYGMPVPQALASAGYGFAYGLWPIAWIIITAVFLPPTLIASFYGMNFTHMPELDRPSGFTVTVLLTLVAAVIPLAYIKRRGWLR